VELQEGSNEALYQIMLARYYSWSLGRFTQPDRITVVRPSDPQSWNRYTYVENNPLKYYDPDGNDIAIAPNVSKPNATWLTNAANVLYATPLGRARMNRLEISPRKIWLVIRRLPALTIDKDGTPHGKAADTRIDKSGEIYIVVDLQNQVALQKAGGMTLAEVLNDEFIHAESAIDHPVTYDENDETQRDAELPELRAQEKTSRPLRKGLLRATQQLLTIMDDADQRKKELQGQGKWDRPPKPQPLHPKS
jgi:RHS repeat-associated protein